MLEHHSKPVLPFRLVPRSGAPIYGVCFLLIGCSLGIGVLGYRYINDLPWLDALLNASMILTGMGPVDPMKNDAAKWFASLYAIFSGVAF